MAKPPPPPIFSMKGNMTEVHCLTFKIDEKDSLLFAGTQSGLIHVWNLKVNRESAVINTGGDPVLSVDYRNNNLICQSKEGDISSWEEQNSKWVLKHKSAQNHLGFCKSIVATYNEELVILCAADNSEIHVLSLESRKTILSLKQPVSEEVLGLVIAFKFIELKEKFFVLSIYENCKMFLWDLKANCVISKLKICEECPMALDFDVSSMKGLCGSVDNKLIAFKIDEQNNLIKKLEVEITNPGVGCIKIRPDKKIVAVGCWDGNIRIFSWRTLKLLAVLEHHTGSVLEVCFSPQPVAAWKTKIMLAAGSKDCRISLWNLYND